MKIKPLEFSLAGHSWRWEQFGEQSFSLCCLDPIVDEQGVDHSTWPEDAALSAVVGKRVRFVDAGDAPEHPEGVYELVSSGTKSATRDSVLYPQSLGRRIL